jgi:PTH1 family peptidyl-tRNA hydrolase
MFKWFYSKWKNGGIVKTDMTDRYLIVGLGNPGREYEHTRHNVGFRCVEALAAKYNLSFTARKAHAHIADGMIHLGAEGIGDRHLMLAKPQTYMNLSGETVGALVSFYKLSLERLIVVSDDMDIPLGTLRLRIAGSAGGQNGLKSVISHLGTQQFARLRFGIGRPPGRMEGAAYVLGSFAKVDEILVDETITRAVKALETWLTDGIEIAMTRYNGSGDGEKTDKNNGKRQKQALTPGPSPKGEGSSDASTPPLQEIAADLRVRPETGLGGEVHP